MLIGELFSLVSLAAGLFFFIFAARYYFSVAFVMARKNRIENRNNWLNNKNGNNGTFHNGANNNNNGKTLHNGGSHNGTNNNGGKTLHNGGTHLKLFHNGNAEGPAETILTRVANWARKVVLGNGVSYGNGENGGNGSSKSVNNGNNNHRNNNHNNHQPFISIHLAFYNEKNVADRILTACTSLSYANYEVIVVDDSKDETVEILKKWQDNPRVKIIHREARKGWKGGALNEALKRMDPRTEYVLVFDADFIPPTDIIQQFLPYFAGVSINGNRNGNHNNHNGNGGWNNNHGNNLNGELNNNHANGHPVNNHKTVNRNDYQRVIQKLELWYEKRELAVVQGYQWHYLNSGENWLTKGIRAEYSASYVIERTYQELTDAMKMISGSVFMIKADVLKKHGWSTSMTEDWELTVRLYLDGYKVAYTPYIQAPCECPSTIPQLVKQRMRWAEGHTYNAKKYFSEVIRSPKLSLREKLEYVYYAPYYLQTFIFLIGTSFWFLSETMHQYLPFWTQVFGWSLLLSNFFSLPMMGLTGLFLEKNVQRDLTGIFSFIVMSYVLVPFIAYASLKGLLEKKERGTWIRTLKTGKITEIITKLELRKVWHELLPKRRKVKAKAEKKVPVPAKTEANGGTTTEQSKKEGEDKTKHIEESAQDENAGKIGWQRRWFNPFKRRRTMNLMLLVLLSASLIGVTALSTTIPETLAASHPAAGTTWYLRNTAGSGGSTDPYDMDTTGVTSTVTMTTNQYMYWSTVAAYMLGPADYGTWPIRIYVTAKTGSPTLQARLYYNTAKSMTGATAMCTAVSAPVATGYVTLDVTVNAPASDTDNLYILLELYASSTPAGKTVTIGLAQSTSTGSYVQVPENLLALMAAFPLIWLFQTRKEMKRKGRTLNYPFPT